MTPADKRWLLRGIGAVTIPVILAVAYLWHLQWLDQRTIAVTVGVTLAVQLVAQFWPVRRG